MSFRNSFLYLMGFSMISAGGGLLEASESLAQPSKTISETIKEKGKKALDWASDNPQVALPFAGVGVVGAVGAGVAVATGVALTRDAFREALKKNNLAAAPVVKEPISARELSRIQGQARAIERKGREVQEKEEGEKEQEKEERARKLSELVRQNMLAIVSVDSEEANKEKEEGEKEIKGKKSDSEYRNMKLRDLFKKIYSHASSSVDLSEGSIFSPEDFKPKDTNFDINEAKKVYQERVRNESEKLRDKKRESRGEKEDNKAVRLQGDYSLTHLAGGAIYVPLYVNNQDKLRKHFDIMGYENLEGFKKGWTEKRKMHLSKEDMEKPEEALRERKEIIRGIKKDSQHPLKPILNDLIIIRKGQKARVRTMKERNK